MFAAFRSKTVASFVGCFMAMHILNISIDPDHSVNNFFPEDLSINKVESFTELIFEHILNYEDCIGETDEGNGIRKISQVVLLFIKYQESFEKVVYPISSLNYFSSENSRLTVAFPELDSPPPRVS